MFDLVGAPGVGADLSHIDSPAVATGHGMSLGQFQGDSDNRITDGDQTKFQDAAAATALAGADIVVIPAGVPRKPGMDRQDLFDINAGLIKHFADLIATHCPKAMVGIITNPVNSTVPIMVS